MEGGGDACEAIFELNKEGDSGADAQDNEVLIGCQERSWEERELTLAVAKGALLQGRKTTHKRWIAIQAAVVFNSGHK